MMLHRAIDEYSIRDFSQELGLLLCTARTRMDQAASEQVKRLLGEDIDWEHLLVLTRQHGVGSLLYWQLNSTCPEAVPADRLSRLQEHFNENTRQNLFLAGELLKAVDMLESEGIAAVPFKGAVLASSAFGHLGLREFEDLDLLVHRNQASKAEELLLIEGYHPLMEFSPAQRAAVDRWGRHVNLFCPSGDARIELHWALVSKYLFPGFDIESFWDRLVEVSIGGTAVPTFCAEDLLLFLCLHAAEHTWARLKWLCDISEHIRSNPDLSWDEFMDGARAAQSERVVLLNLLLAHDLLDTHIPDEIIRPVMGSSSNRAIVNQVKRRAAGNISGTPLLLLKATDDIHEKMALGVRIVRYSVTPTPAEWDMLALPRTLSFLYWIIRPVRLVWLYALKPLRARLSSVLERE